MRRDVDVQEAPAMGAVVCGADDNRARQFGVQQFAKIAGRNGNEAGTVSVGCDGDGAEWSGLKRELDAERPAVAEGRLNSASPGKCGLV